MKKKIAVLTSGWSVDYVVSVINGMKEACSEKNVDLYVFSCYKFTEPTGESNTTGFAIFDLINYKDYDGIIITPNLFNDDERAEYEHKRILASGVPAVSLNQQLDGLHFVNSDNHDTYKEMVNHLIEHHYLTEFAFIGGPDGNPGAESNFNAFKESLTEHNIQVQEEDCYLHGDWSYEFAYEQAKKIFTKERIPQAVVCVNDWAAMAVTQVATENNYSVPEEVMVVGFDDISFAKMVIPSITTVNINAEQMGREAVDLVLSEIKEPATRVIKANIHYRQSCGCITDIRRAQIRYSQNCSHELDSSQRFASQLRHMEDVFIQNETIEKLENSLQNYFQRRHTFEGSDFAIFLKEEVVRNLIDVDAEYSESMSYGKKMRSIVNIQNGVSTDCEIIDTEKLIPENMLSEEPSIYLFLPVFNRKYLHGYYVSKNFIKLLENKSAYNWSRNFGVSIEKFRQTVKYRLMSEQLKILSTKDALSGLLNRTGLDIFGTKLFEETNQAGKCTHIIFIDINSMKIINDKHGHLHGDLAVKTVAEVIRNIIPENYIAIRYGGDEFVIIGSCTSRSQIDFCGKIKESLEAKAKRMSLPYSLTVSYGEKLFEPNEKQNLLDAIEEADKIMYVEKEKFHRENQ